jgi:hypothetical protein
MDHALEFIRLYWPGDDLVELVADLLVTFERDHSGKAIALDSSELLHYWK